MNLQFEELTIVLLILALVGVMLMILRQSEKTAETLAGAYPADTKHLIEQMGGIVVGMAARSSNKLDDQAVQLLVTWLKSQGIEVAAAPVVVGASESKSTEEKPVAIKAPELV